MKDVHSEEKHLRVARDTTHFKMIDPLSDPKRYTMDDLGNGYFFADNFKHCCRFCPNTNEWFAYANGVWTPYHGAETVNELAKHLTIWLQNYTISISDATTRRAFQHNANDLGKHPRRNAMIKDARSVYPIYKRDFDAKTSLFNCKNGTLNLRDFSFSDHSSDDLLSKMSGVHYNPESTCSRWEEFVNEVMEGDQELVKYIQKAIGYALLGEPKEECLFILYGESTRNGKSTMMEVFGKVFGDYCKSMRPESLCESRNVDANSHSEDMARLQGARLVSVNEPKKGTRFNEARIKALTGRDIITARMLHQNSREYVPQFVIMINTNYLSIIEDNTLFKSDRIKPIPFNRHFLEHERDRNLKDKLTTQGALSGIFNWIIEGLKLFREEGLKTPEKIENLLSMYEADSNLVAKFMAECTNKVHGQFVKTTEVYAAYETWCAIYSVAQESKYQFLKLISECGYDRKHAATRKWSPCLLAFGKDVLRR